MATEEHTNWRRGRELSRKASWSHHRATAVSSRITRKWLENGMNCLKSIYACLHVAVQQIQDVLAVSQCPIFFSYPVRPLVSTLPIFYIFGLFFDSVSTSDYIIEKSIITVKWRSRKNTEGNGSDWLIHYPSICLRGFGKTQETSISKACLSVEIQTGHISDPARAILYTTSLWRQL